MDKVLIIDADSLCFRAAKDTLIESIEKLNFDLLNLFGRCNYDGNLSHYAMYLTQGRGNYRYKVSYYKDNRKKREPIPYIQELKDYLVREYKAQSFTTIEADDACAIICNELNSNSIPFIVAHIDSDLKQIPGNHYDYKNDKYYHLTESESNKALYEQLLVGKSKDNVKGLKGFGETAWDNIKDKINSLDDVKDIYLNGIPEIKRVKSETIEYFDENYFLTKLLTNPNSDELPIIHKVSPSLIKPF